MTPTRSDPFKDALLSIRADLDALMAALTTSIEKRLDKLAAEVAATVPLPRSLTEQIEDSFAGLPPMAALAHASAIQATISTATMKAVTAGQIVSEPSAAAPSPAPITLPEPASVEQTEKPKPAPAFTAGRPKAVVVPTTSRPSTAPATKLTEAEDRVSTAWSVAVDGGRFTDVLATGVSRQLASDMTKVRDFLQDRAKDMPWSDARTHLRAAKDTERASIDSQPVDPEDIDVPPFDGAVPVEDGWTE